MTALSLHNIKIFLTYANDSVEIFCNFFYRQFKKFGKFKISGHI